jgi:hypothetical protein
VAYRAANCEQNNTGIEERKAYNFPLVQTIFRTEKEQLEPMLKMAEIDGKNSKQTHILSTSIFQHF